MAIFDLSSIFSAHDYLADASSDFAKTFSKDSFFYMSLTFLISEGMRAQDAEKVLTHLYHDEDDCPTMKNVWVKAYSDYPDGVIATVIVLVRASAVVWVEKNLPEAWYLSSLKNAV